MDFSKTLFSAKLQQILLNFIENMIVFTASNLNTIKNIVEKKRLEQILSKNYSFLIQSLICICNFAKIMHVRDDII